MKYRKKHLNMRQAVSIALAACAPFISSAASIDWEAPSNVSSATDIINEGTLIEAVNGYVSGNTGNITTVSPVINGVQFTGSQDVLDQNTTANVDNFSGDTGDSGYNDLLSSIDFGGGADLHSISLGSNNLVAGMEYLVQVWFVDDRAAYADRVMQYGDGLGNTVNLTAGSIQYVTGMFTADGPSQTLSMDAQGFGNAHITAYQVRTSNSAPTPALTTSTSPVSSSFDVEVTFSKPVTGLEPSDFEISNGTITSSIRIESNDTLSIEITPLTNGYVSVYLPAGTVNGIDAALTPNPASDTLTILYISPDSDQPNVTLTTASTNITGTFTVDVTFSEGISGLTLNDFEIVNGTATNLSGAGAAYSVEIIPEIIDASIISINLPENRVTDLDGDNLWNPASEILSVTYRIPDIPTVSLYGNFSSETADYQLYLTFSEEVNGLDTADFNIVNGIVSSVTPQGRSYSLEGYFASTNSRYYVATITASSPGTVEVSLPENVVCDVDGDGCGNAASEIQTFECISDFGEQWIVDEAADWIGATLTNDHLMISEGYAEPTADYSQFTSIIKTFPVRKKARNITFQQSPAWDNWTNVGEIDPDGASDAPVMVSIEDGNYFYLGLGDTDGYHAWHSTDMVNWEEKGPVAPPVTGRWVTSAEYKDGKFYIYSDYYNDHQPHLFIDTNLTDGVVGEFMGAAFAKEVDGIEGHGSDCSLIRSDDDGLFHLIYEDWSPLDASSHSWDSPLAGHTSSEDGFTGFTMHEHVAPVDHRNTPTGKIGSYTHPHWSDETGNNVCYYEIHEPEQNAYGDWTSIKIGSRFWMFSDYHPAGEDIKLAIFASDSIYGEYEKVGDMHDGHPDPTVCFAEGQFYLITQQNSDYTSPGPWVDGVEARAGVDTDGDGIIDEWTAWQDVYEQYDHTPEYIHVVTLIPAQLNLSALPEGYGFQFEFRIDNTVVTDVSPILDSIVMDFEPSNFQNWANTSGIPAEMNADHNTNGITDLIEFSIGQTIVPVRQADGTLSVTAVNEAIADGLEMELWFTDSLLESWSVATTNTTGVKLLSDTADAQGNHELIFEIFDRNGTNVFWKLAVTSPE